MRFFKSLWHKYLGGKSSPWADIVFEDDQMKVKAYNDAFVSKLRNQMGDLTLAKNDTEIIDLFTSKKSLELEEPKLKAIHLGIDDDGRVKMELDWNPAFIAHLRENGIVAESEDEAIQKYLSLLTKNAADNMQVSTSDVDEAFSEIDEISRVELEQVAQTVADQMGELKKSKRTRRTRKVSSTE